MVSSAPSMRPLRIVQFFVQALVLWIILSGCTTGLLYTDVTYPLTLNMDSTVISADMANSSSRALKDPISGVGISVEWAGYAIGQAAAQEGIEFINYADLRQISYVLGIYQERIVHVYGVKNGKPVTVSIAEGETAESETAEGDALPLGFSTVPHG